MVVCVFLSPVYRVLGLLKKSLDRILLVKKWMLHDSQFLEDLKVCARHVLSDVKGNSDPGPQEPQLCLFFILAISQ